MGVPNREKIDDDLFKDSGLDELGQKSEQVRVLVLLRGVVQLQYEIRWQLGLVVQNSAKHLNVRVGLLGEVSDKKCVGELLEGVDNGANDPHRERRVAFRRVVVGNVGLGLVHAVKGHHHVLVRLLSCTPPPGVVHTSIPFD